jgi:hypothetical protein
MSQESIAVPYEAKIIADHAQAPAVEMMRPSPPSEEQALLADRVFAHSRESDLVLGLLGTQAGLLLLHDIAADTFCGDENEDGPEERPQPRPDPSPAS